MATELDINEDGAEGTPELPPPVTGDLVDEALESSVTFGEAGATGALPRPIKIEFGPIGRVNANKRLYPMDVMIPAVAAAKKKCTDGRLTGMCDHPMFGPGNPRDVAIRWDDIGIEGQRVCMTGEVLATDAGAAISRLHDAGVSLHTSQRGRGNADFITKKPKDGDPPDPWGMDGYWKMTDFEFTSVDVVMEGANSIQRLVMEGLLVEPLPAGDTPVAEVAPIPGDEPVGAPEPVAVIGDAVPGEAPTLGVSDAPDDDDEDEDDPDDEDEDTSEAVWSTAFKNRLPDAAFAAIEPGGKKDADGKTTPRSLRHLPHHGMSVTSGSANDTVDKTHLRNALSELPKTKIDDDLAKRASSHLERHAKALGVGEAAESEQEASEMLEEVVLSQPDVSDTPAAPPAPPAPPAPTVNLRSLAILDARAARVRTEELAEGYPEPLRPVVLKAIGECSSPDEVEAKFEAARPILEGIAAMAPAGTAHVEPTEEPEGGPVLFDTTDQVIEHFAGQLTGEDWMLPQKKAIFDVLCRNYAKSAAEATVVTSHTKKSRAALQMLQEAGLSTDLVIVPSVLPIATQAWDKVVGQELVTVLPIKLPQARVPTLDIVFEAGGNAFTDYLDYQYAGPLAELAQKPLAKISMDYVDVVLEKKAVDFRWSLEQDQDFNAMYGMSVQETLIAATAQRLAIEVDLAIVTAINTAAVAAGLALNFGTTAPVAPATLIAEWWNVGWPQYISTMKQMIRDACHLEPNFCICGTSASRLWEMSNLMQEGVTSPVGFREADFGINFLGYSKGDGLRIYTSPQVPTNRMIFGVRTGRTDNYGVMFCPYIPAYLTDTVTYPRSNEYEKAMGTRFGLVTAHNNYYGYIDVTIAGAGAWLF